MDPTPDKDHPPKKPPSRGAAEENSEDRKFWGLDDEEEAEEPVKEAPAPKKGRDSLDEDLGEELDDLLEENLEDDLDPDLDDELEADLEADLDDDLGEDQVKAEKETGADPDQPPPASPQAAGDRPKLRISRSDAIWMGILALTLLTLVVFAFSMFKSNIRTVGGPDDADFPVKGKNITITEVTTFWRRPNREVDRVKLDAHLIPCAEIELKSGSGTGKLRFFFEDDAGDVLGDPISADFADGKFVETGSRELTINATDGFKNEGQYNAYVPEKINFWHLNVYEGPAAEASSEEFEKILRVRILPKRR